MKLVFIQRIILLSLIATPFGASAQNIEEHAVRSLAKNIRDSRKSLESFQAYGIKSQEGSYFEPDTPSSTQSQGTDYSENYDAYVGFEGIDGRISLRKFSKGEVEKPERFTVSNFSSKESKTTCYGTSGLHLVRPLNGGRYVNEFGGTSIAFPVQTIGFWVSEEKKWPDELLESGRYRIVGERISEKFRREIDIVGKTKDNYAVSFTLAPDFGYRIIKSATEVENVRYETKLDDVVQVDKIWCPKKFRRTVLPKDGSTPSSEIYEFEKIFVNKSGAGDIRFKAQSGDHNHEVASNRHSYTLGDGSRKYIALTENEQSPLTFLRGWLYIGGLSTLLTVIVLGYMQWKRKQLSKPV